MSEHLGSRDVGFRGDDVWLECAIAKIAAMGVEVVADQSGLSFGALAKPNTQSFCPFGAGQTGPAQSLSL